MNFTVKTKFSKQNIYMYILNTVRILAPVLLFSAFISDLNPGRITSVIIQHVSLFTSSISYSKLTGNMGNLIVHDLINPSTIYLLMASSLVVFLGVIALSIGSAFSLGGTKIQRIGKKLFLGGPIAMILGLAGIFIAYILVANGKDLVKVPPMISFGFYYFSFFAVLALGFSIFLNTTKVKIESKKKIKDDFKIEEKYLLFIYLCPILLITLLLSYLPLYGWRYAFFNYKPGVELTAQNFAGLKWFTIIFQDQAVRNDLLIVIRNTLVMSGLGILSSVLPLIFAIFFSEIKNKKLGKFIQTFSTLPNFISWVLIYAFAFSLFEVNGLVNSITGGTQNYLTSQGPIVWFQMLAWGVWKSVGWSAIIYIAAITSLDLQMYEAASIDGAKRFQKMWYITVPSLMPTFSVMLLLSFAGILSNGLEQYLVFRNVNNKDFIRVLDLYVYQLGLGTQGADTQIPLSTVISMVKSVLSVSLLLLANKASKWIRGESII